MNFLSTGSSSNAQIGDEDLWKNMPIPQRTRTPFLGDSQRLEQESENALSRKPKKSDYWQEDDKESLLQCCWENLLFAPGDVEKVKIDVDY